MAQVQKEFIDEATRRGIVEGATVESAGMGYRFVVIPSCKWEFDPGGNVYSEFCIYNAEKTKWATVITPAPSKGLQEGDAVECGPAMRAAIIELAKELGVVLAKSAYLDKPVSGAPNLGWDGMAIGDRLLRGQSSWSKNWLTPEEFIARMRVTAKKPKSIRIGDREVKFYPDEIKVGCILIPNSVVREIASKLVDL